MSNLSQRILTAFIAGGSALALIWFSRWGLFGFACLVSLLSYVEFLRLSIPGKKATQIFSGIMVMLFWVMIAANAWASEAGKGGHHLFGPWIFLLLTSMFMVIGALLFSLFNASEEYAVQTVSAPLFGFWYLSLPFLLYFMLSYFPYNFFKGGEYDPRISIGILLLNWCLDTFAYFGGRFLGKHKLFERISPKKTWEGAIAGVLFCIGLGVIFQIVWPLKWNWIIVAAIISVFSQIGDLAESMFKRNVQIKDSGSLLPGHGGFLDRFDGMFLSTPLVFLYTYFIPA